MHSAMKINDLQFIISNFDSISHQCSGAYLSFHFSSLSEISVNYVSARVSVNLDDARATYLAYVSSSVCLFEKETFIEEVIPETFDYVNSI